MYQITLIPGDGIGPEISSATREVLAATGLLYLSLSTEAPPNTPVKIKQTPR